MGNLRRRKIVNLLVFFFCGVCTFAAVGILFFILGYLFWNGGRYVNWDFFTKLPTPVGESGGGMANAILGSLKIVGLATCMGVPVGFLGGVYLAEYGGRRFPFIVRYAADLLNGVPSIVIGIFAYTVLVLNVKHFSVWAGSFALAIIMVPTTLRTTEEFLRSVPGSLRESAFALGASRWQTVLTVVLPAASKGILAGVLLGIARVAGETAPLLFTSFSNRFWSKSLDEPTASLPVMIYTYAIAPYEDWHRQAWAAGFVLLLMVFVLNVVARLVVNLRTR